jgi:hypothetical protein
MKNDIVSPVVSLGGTIFSLKAAAVFHSHELFDVSLGVFQKPLDFDLKRGNRDFS